MDILKEIEQNRLKRKFRAQSRAELIQLRKEIMELLAVEKATLSALRLENDRKRLLLREAEAEVIARIKEAGQELSACHAAMADLK